MTAAPNTLHVAVIGAGPTGLTCARALRNNGVRVRIFEKSRGLGGRLATRRRDGFQFDHGAPALSLATPDAREWLAGPSAPWPELHGPDGPDHVGVPGMSALCKPLAEGLDIAFEAEVTALRHEPRGIRVETGRQSEVFDRVVLAIPAPQAQRILGGFDDELCRRLDAVRLEPCYTVMVAFDARPDWPDIDTDPPAPFALVLRDSAKPGRNSHASCWVAHATPSWSFENLELPREDAAQALLAALSGAYGPHPNVLKLMGHRWRFARTEIPLGAPFLSSPDDTVLIGGDWALGRNAEHGAKSGLEMAHAVLAAPRP